MNQHVKYFEKLLFMYIYKLLSYSIVNDLAFIGPNNSTNFAIAFKYKYFAWTEIKITDELIQIE